MTNEIKMELIKMLLCSSDDQKLDISNAIATQSQQEPILEVGKCYLFRGVTNYNLGRVELIDRDKDRVKISDASWVADTGCWSELLKNGCEGFKEVEPCPSFSIVNLSACNDIAPWDHDLPRKRIGG